VLEDVFGSELVGIVVVAVIVLDGSPATAKWARGLGAATSAVDEGFKKSPAHATTEHRRWLTALSVNALWAA
jgi:hypothetical protein